MSIAAGLPRFRRPDHHVIVSLVGQGQSVLDVGCGDGRLMTLLRSERGSVTRGLEISADGVSHCLARGLSVVQGDAEKDLAVYPDDSFDCAVLSRSLQAMGRPEAVLAELVRIAPRILVSMDNYGYWRCRLAFLFRGRAGALGNFASCARTQLWSAYDICDLAVSTGLRVRRAISTGGRFPGAVRGEAGAVRGMHLSFLNLVWRQIVFVLERDVPYGGQV